MHNNTKEKIACLIIEMIIKRHNDYSNFEMKENFSVFQKVFIDNYSILIRKDEKYCFQDINDCSKISFLNNIVDNTFFERTAQILCDGEKRKFKELTITASQQAVISEIISSLKNKKSEPNLKQENKNIFYRTGKSNISIPNFDADVYYEDSKNIVLIEIKTVKPNSGIFKVEKEKILLAKAALKNLYPAKNIYFYIAFPFDPLNDVKSGHDKARFFNYSVDFKKFFDSDEVLLADEFWNFLSNGKETMNEILGIINSISKPDFMSNYNFINEPQNLDSDLNHYKELLIQWNLYRELETVNNRKSLIQKSKKDKKIEKLLNQNLFDTEGIYKVDRINTLHQSL